MLKYKLNKENLVKASSTYTANVGRYTAGIVNWAKQLLESLDRITQKQQSLNEALHPQYNPHRFYTSKKAGGRGMMSIQSLVITTI